MKPRIVAGILIALALAGCTAQAAEEPSYPESTAPTTAPPPTVESAAEPETSEEPETTAPADPTTYNSHGNVDKEVGEWASLHTDRGEELRFRITEIAWDPTCDSGIADPPKNGKYLGLHIEVETSDMFDTTYGEFTISSYEVAAFRGDTRVNDTQGNAWTCLSEASTLPYLGVGQHGTGWVVVDAPEDITSFQVVLPGMPAGWEWTLD